MLEIEIKSRGANQRPAENVRIGSVVEYQDELYVLTTAMFGTHRVNLQCFMSPRSRAVEWGTRVRVVANSIQDYIDGKRHVEPVKFVEKVRACDGVVLHEGRPLIYVGKLSSGAFNTEERRVGFVDLQTREIVRLPWGTEVKLAGSRLVVE